MTIDIYFLNPSFDFERRIRNYLLSSGFTEKYNGDFWQFSHNDATISMYCGDSDGKYISLMCEGIPCEYLQKQLSKCPECGSTNLKAILLPSWQKYVESDLQNSKLISYGSACYDRRGTRPETRKCIKCGCKWHNGADYQIWNKIIHNNAKLTKQAVGLT